MPDVSLPESRRLALTLRDRVVLTPLMTRVTLGGDDLVAFECVPGQDLMLAVPQSEGTINRRYTVRRTDPLAGTVDLDVVVHGDGPGARWTRDAPIGSAIDAVGPRGKIVPAADAAFHLFVCDESGWAASAVMAESLDASARAVVVADVAGPDEHQALETACDLQVVWCDRDGARTGEADAVLGAVAGLDVPAEASHAYLSAELSVVRALAAHLATHGLTGDQVSAKAYWRRGTANAAHGEPLRVDS